MKKKSTWPIIFLAVFIVMIILAVQHFHVPDFQIIAPDKLYTCAQPRGMDYTRLLYKYHIATIVNVRLESEHRDRNWYNEEMTWVKENSVKYIELPMDKQDYFPDNRMQSKFIAVMSDNENLPVLLHGSGDDKRVVMLTAVWLRKSQHLSAADTIKQVKKIVDSRPLTEEDISFIDSLD